LNVPKTITSVLKQQAERDGFTSLIADWLQKVRDGGASLQEVLLKKTVFSEKNTAPDLSGAVF